MTKEEAIKVIDNRYEIMGYCESTRLEEALNIAIEALEQPERKKGVWIVRKDCEGKTRTCVCGLCGYTTDKYTWVNPNYCSGCGADMRGEEDG